MSTFPTPYVYLRNRALTALPATLSPANCNPSDMGIQLSSVPVWVMNGTATLEFAMLGKGPHSVPAPQLDTSNPWSIQGAEIRVYFDTRSDRTATFKSDGTTAGVRLVFVGDVHEIRPHEAGGNPWYAYTAAARSLVSRAERVSVVSQIDNSDVARFNLNALKADYEPYVSGKTIGDIILMLLQDYGTAYQLDSMGIGQYTLNNTLETATLPQQTIDDLSKLTLQPPFEVRVTGDNIVAGIVQTLEAYCPNYQMVIRPDGMIRFFDVRVTDNYAINLGSTTQPVDDFVFTKSTLSSYSKVVVQGSGKIVPYYCQWSYARNATPQLDNSGDGPMINGTLVEQFDYTGKTNLASKQAFTWDDFDAGRHLISTGTVSFKDAANADLPSNQIRLIPTGMLTTWGENELCIQDNSKLNRRDCRITIRRKVIKLADPATPGSTEQTVAYTSGTFLPTKNTAVASGSSIVTTSPLVDRDPPYYTPDKYRIEHTYELYGWNPGGAVSWRLFKVALDAKPPEVPSTKMTRRLATMFTQPARDLWFSNAVAQTRPDRQTWQPKCLVEYRWKIGTGYSYNSFWVGFRIDSANNLIILDQPALAIFKPSGTYADVGPPYADQQTFRYVPYNIKAVLPVYDGRWEAIYPPSGSTAQAVVKTSYGIDRTLTIVMKEWQDGRDQAYADQYAKEIWDSVQQPSVTGGFIWVSGMPDEWNAFGIKDVADPINNRFKPVLQGFKVSNTSCDGGGVGIEDCTLFPTSVSVEFSASQAPRSVVSFATLKPRLGAPMHHFHSFAEAAQRDGIMAESIVTPGAGVSLPAINGWAPGTDGVMHGPGDMFGE